MASELRRVQFITSELSPVQWSKVRRPVKKSTKEWPLQGRPVKRQVEKKTRDDDKKNVGNVYKPKEWMDVVDHLEGMREVVKSVSVVLWRSDQQAHVGTSSEKDEGMKTRCS